MKKLLSLLLSALMLLTVGIVNVSADGEYVAKIGDTEYATLAEAFAVVPTNGTETLITMINNENVSADTTLTIQNGQNITLDLNGHNVVGSSTTGESFSFINNKGELTITDSSEEKNGKISSSLTGTGKINAGYYTISNMNKLVLNAGTIEEATVDPGYSNGKLCYAVDLVENNSGAVLTVNGGTIKSTYQAVRVYYYSNAKKATINVHNGTIESCYGPLGVQMVANSPKVDIVIDGGTITSTKGSKLVYLDCHCKANDCSVDEIKLDIKGGRFNSTSTELINYDITSGAYVNDEKIVTTIIGGLYKTEVSSDISSYLTNAYTCAENDDSNTKTDYPIIVKEKDAVASIEDAKFYTLADAIAAVPDGTETTITMIGDEAISGNSGVTIEHGKNIVLELNGHTIYASASEATTAQTILNKGTLTIRDNTDINKDGTGTGKITSSSQLGDQSAIPGYATNTIVNRSMNGDAILTIKSGLIERNSVNNNGWGVAIDNNTNSVSGKAVVNILGGKVYHDNDTSIRQFNCSDTYDNIVNIEDGVVEGNEAIWIQYVGTQKATLNITGGKLVSDGIAFKTSWSSCTNASEKGDGSNVTVNVSSEANITGNFYAMNATKVTFNISSGKFNSDLVGNYDNLDGNTWNISGGYYKTNIASKYIIEGKECIPNTDTSTNITYPWTIGVKKEVTPTKEVVIPEEINNGNVGKDKEQINNEIEVIEAIITEDKAKIQASSVDLMPEANQLSNDGSILTKAVFEKAASETGFVKTSTDKLVVKVETFLDIDVKEAEEEQQGEETLISSFKADITPMFIIKASRYEAGNDTTPVATKTISTEKKIDVDRPVVIKMYLPSNFKSSSTATDDRVWVKHWIGSEESKVYGGTEGFEVKQDSTGGRYIEFVNPDGFSDFEFFLQKVDPDIKPSRKKTRTYVAPVTGD